MTEVSAAVLGEPQEERAPLLPLALVMSEGGAGAESCCSRLASGLNTKQNKMAGQRDGKNLGP